jgi:Cdc6-like AAA superfamily ATPase
LFSGRAQQVRDVINATFQPGQHIVLFGERGVGKTSLAKTLTDLLKGAGITALSSGTINCDGTDDFSSLWHKVFRELQATVRMEKLGFNASPEEKQINLDVLLPEKVAPDDVRYAISRAVTLTADPNQRMLVVFDEVDRIKERSVTTLLADTLKNLSDHLSPVTVIIIGVADAVDQLITEHKSIERSLVQVPMPRMSGEELSDIITKGFSKVGMTITDEAKTKIVSLSQGLPHFTHLLALESSMVAVNADRKNVEILDVASAAKTSVEKSHSLLSAYHKATISNQRNNLFKEVLLACVLTPKDSLGWFSTADVSRPLSVLMKRAYSAPYYSRHLSEFTKDERGAVLQQGRSGKSHRYRFTNPLIGPFIILHAISCGLINATNQSQLDSIALD